MTELLKVKFVNLFVRRKFDITLTEEYVGVKALIDLKKSIPVEFYESLFD